MHRDLYVVVAYSAVDNYMDVGKPHLTKNEAIDEMNLIIENQIKSVELEFGYTPDLEVESIKDKDVICSYDDPYYPCTTSYHVIRIDCSELEGR